MSNGSRSQAQEEILKTIYQELCNSYRAIDEFRAKLLGFLPLATSGVFLLYSGGNILSGQTKEFLAPVGLFGIAISLGLFAYEFYGIQKCGALIDAGKRLEVSLCIENGQFCRRPDRFINEPFAAGIIYPAVLAAWTYLALSPEGALFKYLTSVLQLSGGVRCLIPIIVFAVGFAPMLHFNSKLLAKAKNCTEISKNCKKDKNIPRSDQNRMPETKSRV